MSKRDYDRGWRASERAGQSTGNGPSALERADDRGEPKAWYDGYMDHACGRQKYECHDHSL